MEFNYVFHFSFSYSLYFSILRDFWKSLQVQITNYTNRASFKIALPLLQRCKSNIIFGFSARKVYVWKFNRRGNIASRLHIPHSILFAVCHRQLLPRTQRTCLPSLLHPARISSEPIVWEITLYHTLCTRDQRLQRNAKPKQSIFLNIFIYYWSDYLCIYLLHIISPSNTHRYWS